MARAAIPLHVHILLALSLVAVFPRCGSAASIPVSNLELTHAELPIDGTISLTTYLDGYPPNEHLAIQIATWMDEVAATSLPSGRNVTLNVFLRDNLAPTLAGGNNYLIRGSNKRSLFNDTYGYTAELMDFGRPHEASRWYAGVMATYINDPPEGVNVSANATVERIPVTLRAGWGGKLCTANPRGTVDWASKVRRCEMMGQFTLHTLPGWSFREEGVALQIADYRAAGGRTGERCTELTLNNSCSYWYPRCDENGYKLPPCTAMCYEWAKGCRGLDPAKVCVAASAEKCTGFKVPDPGLGASAILLIVLVSLIILGILFGSLIGVYRKRKYREALERESAARAEARIPDQFGITSGPSAAPPVLHQATISFPSQQPTRPKQVRTFDVTNFDDPADLPSGSGERASDDDSDK